MQTLSRDAVAGCLAAGAFLGFAAGRKPASVSKVAERPANYKQ
jgi:hypothetical protein